MKPVLFKAGPISIYSYGALLAAGFLAAVFLATRKAKKEGISPAKILDLALVILITGVVGSRLLYVLLNWSDFSGNPLRILLLNKGGLAIYGGFGLSIPAGLWFVKKNGLSLWRTADFIVPYVALAQSVGRVGCFLNGCCYGKATDSIFGVYFPGHIFKIHPTQLYSAAALMAIYGILRVVYKMRKFDGQVFCSYLLLYSLFRFFIEFLRVNPSFYQYASLVLCLMSIGLYIKLKRAKQERG